MLIRVTATQMEFSLGFLDAVYHWGAPIHRTASSPGSTAVVDLCPRRPTGA